MRIGTGYDMHRLEVGHPFILGGVKIPFDKGSVAHSDGDTLLHAITDALLGAAALGDIGGHFPDTDPQNKGKESRFFLGEVGALIRKKGFKIENIDATIILQAPKLAEYIPAMRNNIAECLDLGLDRVSIKAKTNEKLDAIGHGNGVAVHAVVLLSC
ncbi:MAG: 2-C-methyl-D-erythritol 2,4-cyclodiphosphate synthase [Deltaproteobacteria bacterium]|nr:2-C-methyl-D-erythritol 2,4-cyclodiphosphate synthase [Deltaproteobacteria bacterium]